MPTYRYYREQPRLRNLDKGLWRLIKPSKEIDPSDSYWLDKQFLIINFHETPPSFMYPYPLPGLLGLRFMDAETGQWATSLVGTSWRIVDTLWDF